MLYNKGEGGFHMWWRPPSSSFWLNQWEIILGEPGLLRWALGREHTHPEWKDSKHERMYRGGHVARTQEQLLWAESGPADSQQENRDVSPTTTRNGWRTWGSLETDPSQSSLQMRTQPHLTPGFQPARLWAEDPANTCWTHDSNSEKINLCSLSH